MLFWVFCCLSLKALCHGVACPALTALWLSRDTPLCCTFLSWPTLFVAPPTGLCHVAPTFVQDSLHVTKKPTGWPLFNHCLIRGLCEGSPYSTQNEKRLRTVPPSGWSQLHLNQFKYEVVGRRVSGTQPSKWQLAGSGPSLPGATQTFPLPSFYGPPGSPGSLSAMHYFAPSF